MSDLPLVSIVTPSYNQAQFLEQTILSVLNQNYQNIEYIVIDGGSKDRSVEIIRKYEDRIAYWVSEPDKGQADAINKGWERCHGQILAFLNSDDYYLPGAISKVVDAFEQHPEVGIVVGQAQWVSEDSSYFQTTNFRIEPSETFKLFDFEKHTSVPQPAAFVRKTVLDKVGMLDPSFHYGLDGEFFLRVFTNFKGISLSDPLACMRLHEASKSVASGIGFASDIMRVAEKIIANPQNYPRSKVVPKKVLAASHIISARACYINGSYRDAASHLLASARLSMAYWAIIVGRELPRMITRMLVGKQAYARISAFARRRILHAQGR